jgi:biopolymer transport protein ExbD
MSVGENKGGAMAEMNVVPLIDILLVLLIIFMVITPLMPTGLDAAVPQPSSDAVTPAGTVVVQVERNGKLKINNEDTDFDLLGARIEQIFKNRADKVAFVKGDDDVLFMDIARTIDIMRGSGIDTVGLISDETKDHKTNI